jgi:hypothetical protein
MEITPSNQVWALLDITYMPAAHLAVVLGAFQR